jgi:AmmeMemoRadiSam system protein A
MKELLGLSREVLKSELTGETFKISDLIKKKFDEKGASFVTLTINGELRGCIGSLEAYQMLWKDIVDNSINAGFNDPRFNPISLKELEKIKIEISVLTKPEKLGIGLKVFDKIDEKMGIILKKGYNRATFLPQVWDELVDKKEFLEHLARKAGLGKDDWKSSELEFYRVESVKE